MGQASDTARKRHQRILIMGPQGAGKGTQAARLAEHLGVPTISTGDLFRAHIRNQTELGKLARAYTDAGELVPDSVTDAMVRARLAEPDAANGFILDGYPRNAAQVAELERVLADAGWELDDVVELIAGREELVDRLVKRAEIEGRADDTPDLIERRLDIYHEHTAPLTDAYAKRGLLRRVDAIGEVPEVTQRIVAKLS